MHRIIYLSIFFQVALGQSQIPQREVSDNTMMEFKEDAIKFLREEMKEHKVPGLVVSMVHMNQEVFNIGIGLADIESNKLVNADSTIFRIGSISKLLTSLAIMRLVDNGKLDLDKDVNSYFEKPLFKDRFGKKVLVRDLLNHRGGFDQKGYNRKVSDPANRPKMEDFLRENLIIAREPGIVGVYDTYGITLIGKLIEEVTGLSYKKYMENHFLKPIGMTNSYVESKSVAEENLAIGYGYSENQLTPQPYEWYITTPASSIDATSGDMSKLLQALLNNGSNKYGTLLSPRINKQVLGRQDHSLDSGVHTFSYGFWEDSANGVRSIEHGGIVFGYESKLYIIPDLKLGFFIAYNRDPESGRPTNLTNRFTKYFVNYFVGNDSREEIVEPKILVNTNRYAGTYVGNLGCFTCPAGSGWPIYDYKINSLGPGKIEFLGGEFVAEKKNVFQYVKSKNRIQFIENRLGEIQFLIYRNRSYIKIGSHAADNILPNGWSKFQRTRFQQLLEDQSPPLGTFVTEFNKKIRFELIKETQIMEERASTGGISWVDFDNDGDDDAFVTNGYDVSASNPSPQTNWLYANNNGTFSRVENKLSQDQGFSSGSAWADFDNDGNIDVFVPNQKNQDNFLYKNLGNGTFKALEEVPATVDGGLSFTSTWGDIDNDGYVDLFVSNGGLAGKGKNFLYKNENGKSFSKVNGIITQDSLQSGGATFVDYDLDGDVDLYVPGETIRMYTNNGNGRFTLDTNAIFTHYKSSEGICTSGGWADFDNDGDFDLLQVYTGGEKNRLYVNKGNMGFERAYLGDLTSDVSASFHVLWLDIDNDGFQDVIVPNWGTKALVYISNQGRSFKRINISGLSKQTLKASMVSTSDFDLDGDLDLAIGNWPNNPGEEEANLLFRNESDIGNFIKLRLVGKQSNSSAIGARIVIYTDSGLKLTREIRSQDGFRSQSSLTQLIGIGKSKGVKKVKIYWPSGVTQQLGKISKGRLIIVHEP